MTKKSETIVFFGSGPVAAQSLAFLLTYFKVESVITKTKKPSYRDIPPVEKIAQENNLTIFYADNANEVEQAVTNNKLTSRLGVLVDYGVIVSKKTITHFSAGIINSHFSLLPEWRGADPITFSILSGQTTTGVSLMLVDEGLDTGNLIAQEKLNIDKKETTQTLTKKLIDLSNQLLIKTIPSYLTNTIKPFKQPPTTATYSKKITKSDGEINWQKDAPTIEREIRAFLGWPKSYTTLFDKKVTITKAHTITSPEDSPLAIPCGDKTWLMIDELIPENSRPMNYQSFLNGLK